MAGRIIVTSERSMVGSRTVLVIEDDAGMRRFIQRALEPEGWSVLEIGGGTEVVSIFERDRPSVVLLDLNLPTIHGIDLLDVLRERDSEPAILVLTGDTSPETAAAVLRRGAEHYLTKPISVAYLQAVVEQAYEKVSLRRRARILETLRGSPTEVSYGDPSVLRPILEQIRRLAPTDSPLLIQGEPGTGKNSLAQLIHQRSSRSDGPFLRYRCATELAANQESDLFGRERERGGEHKRGLFDTASGGTLVLDDVEALSATAQLRLVEYLETGYYQVTGGEGSIRGDVRIVAIADRELLSEVRERRFRDDLYYRLSTFTLLIPPLRSWPRDDLGRLAEEILRDPRLSAGLRREISLSPAAKAVLFAHDWPGNIRELRNVLERTIIYHLDVDEILPEHLPATLTGGTHRTGVYPFDPTLPLEEVEHAHIRAALEHFQGSRSAAAKSLGISRATLYNKLAKMDGEAGSAG